MPDALGMTEAEAARSIGVNTRTLRRWRRKGALGYMLTPGGRIRYSSEDLRRLLHNMKVDPELGDPLVHLRPTAP